MGVGQEELDQCIQLLKDIASGTVTIEPITDVNVDSWITFRASTGDEIKVFYDAGDADYVEEYRLKSGNVVVLDNFYDYDDERGIDRMWGSSNRSDSYVVKEEIAFNKVTDNNAIPAHHICYEGGEVWQQKWPYLQRA